MTNLVKMSRDGKSADVHPLEVDNYSAAGWVAAEAGQGDDPVLYSVFKLKDGAIAARASKTDLTLEDAQSYVEDRPDNDYEIRPVED